VTNQDRNKAWGYALFGDDLRSELGGKTSFMGLYQADMIFSANIPPPIVLTKFVIQIMYYEVVDSIEGDLSFRVTYGPENQVVVDAPVLRKDLSAANATNVVADDSAEDSERIFHLRMPIILSPFPLQTMGRLRVRAHYSDGAVLKLGSILMRQISEMEFQVLSGVTPSQ
jgi:hypothetical protein